MKTTNILIILMLIVASCSKSNNNSNNNQSSNPPCAGTQTEYVCWTINSTNHSVSNLVKDRIADVDAEGLRHYAFGDSSSPNFYIEFEYPTQITLNQTYQVQLPTNNQYDWDCGFGLDTVFTSGTFTMRENNSSYIAGGFTATDAEVNGTPINLTISQGWFKLFK